MNSVKKKLAHYKTYDLHLSGNRIHTAFDLHINWGRNRAINTNSIEYSDWRIDEVDFIRDWITNELKPWRNISRRMAQRLTQSTE